MRPPRRRRLAIVLSVLAAVLALGALLLYVDSQLRGPRYPDLMIESRAVYDARIYANSKFVFKGTVLGMREMPSGEEIEYGGYDGNAPLFFLLDMRVDEVYAGDRFQEGDSASLLYLVVGSVTNGGAISRLGPVVEVGRSFALACGISADAQAGIRYYDLIAQSDLCVLDDSFSFPVKDGLIYVWSGRGWKNLFPPTIELDFFESKEFNAGLFYGLLFDEEIPAPIAYYYSDEDFARAIGLLRTMEPQPAVTSKSYDAGYLREGYLIDD